MNKLLTTLTIGTLLLLLSFSLQAQTEERPNALGFRVLFLDYFTVNNSESSATLDDISNGFELSYYRHLAKNFDFAVPLRFGVANVPDDIDRKSIVGLDALIKAKFPKEGGTVTPYLFAGGGYVLEDMNKGHFQVPVGLGVNFKTWQRAAINAQAAYRYSPTVDRKNLELGLGFIVNLGKVDARDRDSDGDGVMDIVDKCPRVKGSKLAGGCPDKDGDGAPDKMDDCPNMAGPLNGCPDKDNDGVADKDDECPDVAGVVENKGCPKDGADMTGGDKDMEGTGMTNGPDADGDGVPDSIDECPTEAGTAATTGCPDSDGDGVANKNDLCPNESGIAALNGCPDSDGDGVANNNDNCPNTKGLAQLNGCPDSDNDGVANPNDKCPDTAGSPSNFGCPEIGQDEKDALALATRAIRFETGKTTLATSSYSVLDQITSILNRYPNYKVSIAGHTDDVGNADNNYRLSEERAKSCYNYLLSKGFDVNRMSFIGYGETQPISSNTTREGRRLNRRVEFNLYLE